MSQHFSIEEDLSILKEYDLKSYIKGYHAYMQKWNPTIGELLKARLELENEYDKLFTSKNDILPLMTKCGSNYGLMRKCRQKN